MSSAWKTVKLSGVAKIYDGTHQTPDYVNNGVPFFSVEHVTSDNFSETKYISEDVFQNESRRVAIEKGDILMTRIGDVGKAKYIGWEVRASFYVSLALLKCKDTVDPQFISFLINSAVGQREIWAKTLHVAFPNKINLGDIGRCTFDIPPKQTQTQIARILSTWDEYLKKLDQKIEAKKQIKKGLMQRLLSGKRRLPGFFHDWEATKIGGVSRVVAGGTPSTSESTYWENGDVLWMKSGEVNKGRIYDTVNRITEKGLRESSATILPRHSVLIALAGQGTTRGKVAINEVPLSTNQSVAAFITSNKLHYEFLYFNLGLRYEELRSLSAGDSGRGGLNLTLLKNIKIMLPDIDEQKEIAKVISCSELEISKLIQHKTLISKQKDYLLNNLISGKVQLSGDLQAEGVIYA